MSLDGFKRVSKLEDLAEGLPEAVELGDNTQVCLIRVGDAVHAISNNCTHAEFPMSDGEMVEDFIIECGLHGAQFDIRDGSVVELPAMEAIACYQVEVRDGEVWVKPRSS